MFQNLEIIAKMSSPVAVSESICLDAIISAAKAIELLNSEYYSGTNKYGSKEEIDSALSEILDKRYGVYCTSYGIGDNREFLSSWSKRWNCKDDVIVKKSTGKHRVDLGGGEYKNYHTSIVLKSYKEITFYARGNKEKISELLCRIHSLGKKRSQGYGRVKEWVIKVINEDKSIFCNNKLMRHIPRKYYSDCENTICTTQKAIIPPYWRTDNIEMCVVPIE